MSNLIVFEGPDFSGKSTIVASLLDILQDKGMKVRYNSGVVFPTEDTIRAVDFASKSNDGEREFFYTIAYIQDKIKDEQINGLILQDRYWPSVVAYGRLLNGEKSIHKGNDWNGLFYQPDSTIFLSCSYNKLVERLKYRPGVSHLDNFVLEAPIRLAQLESYFRECLIYLPNTLEVDTTEISSDETTYKVYNFLSKRGLLE